jgi:hypothetical protein
MRARFVDHREEIGGPDAIPKSTFRYPVAVTRSVEGDVFQIIQDFIGVDGQPSYIS